MIKINFVCHGNICRSPMAEFVMKKLVREAGLEARFRICSTATSAEELGHPVYPPARRMLQQHGIDCTGKVAVRLKNADYEKYDYFVCMDGNNIRNMMRIFGADPDEKITKLLSWTDRPGDVADPWYTGDFEETWRDVNDGCRALLAALCRKHDLPYKA